MFYLFQPLPGSDFINTLFASSSSYFIMKFPSRYLYSRLVWLWMRRCVWMTLLMCTYGWHLCVCEWMRLMCMGYQCWMDEIIVYDCYVWLYICIIMCRCVIFQFKTGVKLKWGCVEPLIQINFWWLDKTTESRPEIFLAVYMLITAESNCRRKLIYFYRPP
jgi:hypothetical protein